MAKEEKKEKIVLSVGKRKTSVARARIKAGNGKIIINDIPLDLWEPEYARLKIREPLMLADNLHTQVDIKINVKGGGVSGQADAIRQAIAKGLVEFFGSDKLKEMYLNYDRSLLVYDYRRTETHHAGGASKRGARRHKQRSKR